jgi:RNA-directed DNA polymerase
MHENRETSSLAAPKGSSPAGEGGSRKTGMNGGEEPDGAVVPMSPSNKATAQQAEAAEREEGRTPTKENTGHDHTPPAQDGNGVSQGLAGVRKVAKERKQERFTTLLHHVTVDLLRSSYRHLRRNAAPGVDGMRWQEYEDGLEERLADLKDRIHRGAYRAQPSRRIYIPKADGRQRPIGIAALEDKIVQQAVVTILNEIYEVDFRGFSYGFRPGRDPHQALDALNVGIQRKRVNWILDAGIRSYFDQMSHEWTEKFVQHRIADKRILRLVSKWLKAGVSEDGEWSETKVGTPQGAVISPLLANLFLHYAFDRWMAKRYPQLPFERFADDAIVHGRTEAEAQEVRAAIAARLRECGLELHPEKTKIVYCKDDDRRRTYSNEKFDFLGYTFRPRRSKNRTGKHFINFSPAVSDKAVKAIRAEIRSWRLHLRSDKSIEDLSRMFNPIIRGWLQYYGRFYRSALYPPMRQLDRSLARWAARKYKKLRRHLRRATHWVARISRRDPQLWAHWQMGVRRGSMAGAV